jgi:deazaflavin-dependent oxidoreductase (nitroreductase family)
MGGAAKFGRERPEGVLAPSDESHPGAGTGKAVGEGLANSPRCPGDQYSFSLQLHFSSVRRAYGLGSDSEISGPALERRERPPNQLSGRMVTWFSLAKSATYVRSNHLCPVYVQESPMGDADAAAIRAARGHWVREHLEVYLTSGGTRGHILDVSAVGGRALTTHCLIKCVGRKSAKVYVRPLIYGNVGGEIVIVASKGGADTHPGWYLNVLASDTIGVQIATQAFEATWREPEGEERHQVWAYMAHLYPPYLTYQQSTSRQIPLVMLTPGRPIDVFSAEGSQ